MRLGIFSTSLFFLLMGFGNAGESKGKLVPDYRKAFLVVEKAWPIKLKAFSVVDGDKDGKGKAGPDIRFEFLFEFEMDVAGKELDDLRKDFAEGLPRLGRAPKFTLYYFDADNVVINSNPVVITSKNEITGVKGDAFRAGMSSGMTKQGHDMVKKVELRPVPVEGKKRHSVLLMSLGTVTREQASDATARTSERAE